MSATNDRLSKENDIDYMQCSLLPLVLHKVAEMTKIDDGLMFGTELLSATREREREREGAG